jgi:hypothetical protein
MKSNRKDISGQRFGRLYVLSYSHYKPAQAYWHCQCTCGKMTIKSGAALRRGTTSSCGCLQIESARQKQLDNFYKHGKAGKKIYSIYINMLSRCSNKQDLAYPYYGGRGVSVCETWQENFSNFLQDMGEPTGELTLDRKDNNGNYTKDNCHWATKKQQANNRRNNVNVERNGETKTLKEWCEYLGMPYKTVHRRIAKYDWGIEEALTIPVDRGGVIARRIRGSI